jgi:hypothetical protein
LPAGEQEALGHRAERSRPRPSVPVAGRRLPVPPFTVSMPYNASLLVPPFSAARTDIGRLRSNTATVLTKSLPSQQDGHPSTGWWTVTTRDDLERWGEASLAFPARSTDRFARRESHEEMAKFLRGLVAPVGRTKGWQVVEAVGDATPDPMPQRLSRVRDLRRPGGNRHPGRGRLPGDPIETHLDGEPLRKEVASWGAAAGGRHGRQGRERQIGVFLGFPSEPTPMGCPSRSPLPQRPQCRLLPGPTEGLR